MTVFSLLLPVTNDVSALQATLSSQNAQTRHGWADHDWLQKIREGICFNSDGTAGSGLWLMAQSAADPRVTPYTNPGSGDIAAVRYGLNLTDENPVLICFAGETLAPDVLRRLHHDPRTSSDSKPHVMMTQTAMQVGKPSSSTPDANNPVARNLHSLRVHLARSGLPVHRYGWLRLLPKTMTNAENASLKTTQLLHGAIGRVAWAILPVASFLTSGLAGRQAHQAG